MSLRRFRARLTPASVHVTVLGLAAVLLVAQARRMWWTEDDWDFLLHRGLHHADEGLFVPHTQHWSTVPILIFRALYTLFGLHHYLPYALPVIVLHLVLAHLVWRIALRSGARPWVATGVVAAFCLAGQAAEDVLWDFQVGFVGSVTFGAAAFLVADTRAEQPRRWPRLLAVWGLLVLSLASSGVGVTMTIVVAGVAAVRRRWRWAFGCAIVPAAVQLAWYLHDGRASFEANTYGVTSATASKVPGFVLTGIEHTLRTFCGVPGTGLLLVVLMVAGVGFLLWRTKGVVAPAAVFAVGGVVFYLISALGRVGAPDHEAVAPRYLYIALALLIPALAVVVPRRAVVALPVVALLLVSSWIGLRDRADTRVATIAPERQRILAAAELLSRGETLIYPLAAGSADPDITVPALAGVVRRREISLVPQSAAVLEAARLRAEVSFVAPQAPGLSMLTVGGSGIASTPAGSGCVTVRVPRGAIVTFTTGGRAGGAVLTPSGTGPVAVDLRSVAGGPRPTTAVPVREGVAIPLTVTATDSVLRVRLSGTTRVCDPPA